MHSLKFCQCGDMAVTENLWHCYGSDGDVFFTMVLQFCSVHFFQYFEMFFFNIC